MKIYAWGPGDERRRPLKIECPGNPGIPRKREERMRRKRGEEEEREEERRSSRLAPEGANFSLKCHLMEWNAVECRVVEWNRMEWNGVECNGTSDRWHFTNDNIGSRRLIIPDISKISFHHLVLHSFYWTTRGMNENDLYEITDQKW